MHAVATDAGEGSNVVDDPVDEPHYRSPVGSRRVVRRIEPWSVFRVALAFWISMFATMLVAAGVLWTVAAAAGSVDNTEEFIREMFALEVFEFQALTILRVTLLVAIVGVLVTSAVTSMMAVIYNLIARLVGGVEIQVSDPSATPHSLV